MRNEPGRASLEDSRLAAANPGFVLAVFGLLDHPSILAEGVTLARTGAAALSLALTGAILLLLRSSHPPT